MGGGDATMAIDGSWGVAMQPWQLMVIAISIHPKGVHMKCFGAVCMQLNHLIVLNQQSHTVMGLNNHYPLLPLRADTSRGVLTQGWQYSVPEALSYLPGVHAKCFEPSVTF